jgi:C1A family cysteine protease
LTFVIVMKTALKDPSAIVATFLLVSLLMASAMSGAAPEGDTEGHESGAYTKLAPSYHRLTDSEMTELRAAFGTRSSQIDYNVLIDGHGTGLSPPSLESWHSMVGSLNVVDSLEADPSSVPSSFDLSTEPTFPAVGDQARQPSCAAWAGTYYAYGFAEASDLDWVEAKTGTQSQLLSPAWTYSKVNGGRDSGSWTDENMFIVRDWGTATLATMPYDDSEYLDWGSPSAFREAPQHRASEVFYMPYSSSSTIDDIKLLVSGGTLVTFALDANQLTPSFDDDNYVVSSAEYSSTSLNHAQTIVGFDDSLADDGDVGAFRVVNSWGSEWGDEGFYWFTYDAIHELGAMNLLYLNYIADIPDYAPELIACWHFNNAPSRSADIELGIGLHSSPSVSKTPFYVGDRSASHVYPTFMCLDVTEFSDHYAGSDDPFYLEVGFSSSKGVISSFKVEEHSGDFLPGRASRSSAQSEDVPESTPGAVSVLLPHHEPVSIEEALDSSPLTVAPADGVQWVGVNHESVLGGDSMQSGDVGDGETTAFSIEVIGPVEVSFEWKVSSEPGSDFLTFEVQETGVRDSISGDQDWSERAFDIGEGLNTLVWSYSKDSSVSELDDTAWLDSIIISSPLIDFSLQESYTTLAGTPITVTPLEISAPSSSEVQFWFDWGDGSPSTMGDPLSAYSSSHTYAAPGQYELTVTMEDEDSNSVVRTAEVDVGDTNQRPTVNSFEVSPDLDYYEPYSAVRFDVSVIDAEGDAITVSVEIPSLGVALEETVASDPGAVVLVHFDYTCPSGSETPYEVVATSNDDAEHLTSGDWDSDSLSLLVNTPPVPEVVADSLMTAVGETVEFDASGSYDAETPYEDLEARWDWDSDGAWDTDWSTDLVAGHCFLAPGTYVITVEVRDSNDLTSTATVETTVTGDPIPEFSTVFVPVVLTLLVLVAVARSRRARR